MAVRERPQIEGFAVIIGAAAALSATSVAPVSQGELARARARPWRARAAPPRPAPPARRAAGPIHQRDGRGPGRQQQLVVVPGVEARVRQRRRRQPHGADREQAERRPLVGAGDALRLRRDQFCRDRLRRSRSGALSARAASRDAGPAAAG